MGRSVLGPRKTIEETLATTEQEGFTLKKDLSALDVGIIGSLVPGRLRRLLQAAHPAARDGRREQMSSITSRNRFRCPR